MKTSRLHTLREVLESGITVDNVSDVIRISSVFIPKIQRSYAQGRISETDVRTDFLNDIFTTLIAQDDITLELSFLFGSKQKLIVGGADGFELLDGQQRTTTLFLLYWYLNVQESDKMPEFLSRFTYETRDTSTQFLSKISRTKMVFGDKKPSTVIKSNKWFTEDFYCDATISAMLNTLDDIHTKYIESGRKDLLPKLDRLQFYVLLLEHFDRNDELYIKMNSRGLSLIPFENFKASVVKYMKAPEREGLYGTDSPKDNEIPYWLDFTSKLDAKWIDIFWENTSKSFLPTEQAKHLAINDHEIGSSYFRFFNRYFFTKAALLKGVENRKMSDLPAFFYNNAESEDAELRLKGWDKYEALFDIIAEEHRLNKEIGLPVFGKIERILDAFHSFYPEICSMIKKDPYGNTKAFDVRLKDGYTLSNRVVFAALTEFIEAIPHNRSFGDSIIKENFKRMLRVVHNIIENTLIETPIAAIGVISAISEIIHFPGATDGNFYESLANNNLTSRYRQIIEEKNKAKEMFSSGEYDSTWEEAFMNAESHPFFKGSIAFFFTPGAGTSDDFTARYNVVKDLFDANGISPAYRDKHILIRAILSCLNHWDSYTSDSATISGMNGRYFTENSEKEKYLKNIIVGCPEVTRLFCDYFLLHTCSIVDYLKDVIQNAAPAPDVNDASFIMLYQRIINGANADKVYDWIAAREADKKSCFRIQNNRSYIIAIPSKWFDQLVLDTERHLIIPDFVNRLGFQFVNKDKESCFTWLGDAWGWQIGITKKVLGQSGIDYEFRLIFDEWKNVNYYIYGPDIPFLMTHFQLSPDNVDSGRVKVATIAYRLEKDKQPLEEKIKEIEAQLSLL